ncbi:SET and MYND domain-containing protein 4-like [Sitodiplosis mosellana]|uniref:SET and MYND domain-containing protein 4-like n=1 Tax=Sitodiplosis mosellana TaxID=263140 RepID=UPI002443997F|nr:SET and MYND domain-containing protein 4-like [Sitodiplosis mosellana]
MFWKFPEEVYKKHCSTTPPAMDNLWKKDSNEAGAFYVDLFASYSGDKQTEGLIDEFAKIVAMACSKDDEISTMYRQRGNDCFRVKNWSAAMDLYNRSLCFAEVKSENIALAYSNRSAAFFQMQKYEEALVDIELSKQANLPERLMPKLEQRQRECQKLMATVQKPNRREFKLSYEANQNFPCIADVVEIKYNREFGRHLVAKCDIPVGQIILMERDFIGTRANDEILCRTCFRKNRNFIACPQCPDAVFCDIECMNRNILHKWECGSSQAHLNHDDRFYIQSIFMAIECFPDIESLMEFVESALREDPETIPTTIHDLKSSYHFFIKLKTHTNNDDVPLPYDYYKCVTSIPEITTLFDCEKKRRFLMHLVTYHFFITQTNAIHDVRSKSVNNVFSMTNHSCAPNLTNYCIGDQCICETIRFVKEGEQLYINYLGNGTEIAEERRMDLKSRWDFNCKCEKCEPTDNINNTHLVFDPRFQFALENLPDERNYPAILEKCRQFLDEHGHLAWSKEIGLMTHTFAFVAQELYIKPLQ